MQPDQQQMPIEIVVPIPLEKAAARLQSQHENATLWAWKGQTRTMVKTKIVDANTVSYQVKRVPKSWLSGQTSLMAIKGNMHRLDRDSTLVVGKPEMSLFWTIFLGLMFAGMMVAGAVVYRFDSTAELRDVIWLFIAPLIILPFIIGGAWWDQWRLKKLINKTFKDVPPIYGSRSGYDSF